MCYSRRMTWLARLHRWANRNEWILFLLLVVLVLRAPSLFVPHFYGDEEIYLVMGRAWREGLSLYRVVFDHKPPGIYVVAGVFNNLFAFHAALTVAMLGQTVLFWLFARRFWEARPKLAYISSLVFTLLTTLQWFEGLVVNAELFMMIPVVASLLMVWRLDSTRSKNAGHVLLKYFVGGIVAGIGLLFKIPVAADILAIALYLFAFRKTSFWGSIRGFFSWQTFLYLGGFILPLGLTLVYYFTRGIGHSYLSAVFTDNFGYISSGSLHTFSLIDTLKNGLVARTGILVAVVFLLYLLRKRLPTEFVFATLWFSFSFYAALLSGRPYPHYLLQPIVPFSLLLPFVFVLDTVVGWMLAALLLFIGIVAGKSLGFGTYPLWTIYTDEYQLVTKQISYSTYLSRYTNAPRNYDIGAYLLAHMLPEDRLYVWGADATLYNITDRLPAAGRYTVSFHVADMHAYDEVIQDLRAHEPRYIVILPSGGSFPELSSLLSTNYVLVHSILGSNVYLEIGSRH